MGLRALGDQECWICGVQIEDMEAALDFPHFLDDDHALFKFSDGLFHNECLCTHEDGAEFLQLHAEFEVGREKARAEMGEPGPPSAELLEALRRLEDSLPKG